jgi:hypothetical protein
MLELLQKYPEAGRVVKAYFLEILISSLKTEGLPEDFKDHVRAQGIDDEVVAKILDNAPRNLFDVFDENNQIIEISVSGNQFSYKIFPRDVKFLDVTWYPSRKEAEHAAVADAFATLDKTLKQNENEDRSNSGTSDIEVPTAE